MHQQQIAIAPNNKPQQLRYLILICAVAALGGFLFGFDTAVISGVVGFVKTEYAMTSGMEGWFVSSALLGCILGVSVAGKLSDSYGRKIVLLLSALLFTVSALGCMLVQGEALLISFRLIGGLGIGVASMVSPLYITEFSPAALRGRMVTLYQLAITIGILCAYFSNAWLLELSTSNVLSSAAVVAGGGIEGSHSFFDWILHDHVWRGMLGIGIVPALLFLLCLFWIPESPRWLMMRGKEAQARKLLLKVNDEAVVSQEVVSIKAALAADKIPFKVLLSPKFRVALIIGLLLPFLSQLSGINAVIYYGPRILDEAGFTLGSAFGGQVTIGIVNVLFTVLAIFTVDKWGRKPLLYLGVSSAIVALVCIGILFQLNITSGPWILLLILLYIASFAVSFGPVCWIIIGEIFPTHIRGRAMALATLSLWVANFFVGQLTPMLLDSVGAAGTFWIFAILCSPTLWLTWKLIPETKGQSLEAIEAGFQAAFLSGKVKTEQQPVEQSEQ
ncbi:MAG TPA: sugar porter family MFS transporter [Arachidicoccus sp.]|nr:sugar porter family MFS transporter [Arachidicoccus sp.]